MLEIKKVSDIKQHYNNKLLIYFLKCSFGINNYMIIYLLNLCKLNKFTKLKINDLSDITLFYIINKIVKINNIYQLKLHIMSNINNLRKIKTYKYIRHVTNLPVNGQRTHTNRKTKRNFLKFVDNHKNKHIFKI